MIMDNAAYWLLTSVVELKYPISILVSENIELHFNRESHGLHHQELMSLLNKLFQHNYLSACVQGSSCDFTPTTEQVAAALRGEASLYYGLTLKGGALWEDLSKPQWDLYIVESRDGEGTVEIASANRDLVEECLSLEIDRGYQVDTKTAKWSTQIPWQATYWKLLDKGYVVSLRYELDSCATVEKSTRLLSWESKVNAWYVPLSN